jgi:hypothetical protein
MTERFKELAEQAYQWALNESKGGLNICTRGSDYFLAMEKKKFAELIVLECAKIAGKAEYSDTWLEPVEDAIKKHFGVEE